jgi:hypothetical protein
MEKTMPFIANLPTFDCLVTVYKWLPDDEYWELQDEELSCQVYTGKRGQDDTGQATLWLLYRKTDDILRDVMDYNNTGQSDVVVVHFPSNAPRDVGYKVTCVQPRWLEFSNEHMMAKLDRITPDDLQEVIDSVPPEISFQERALVFVSSDGPPDHAPWTEDGGGTFATATPGVDGDDTELLTTEPETVFDLPVGAVIVGVQLTIGKDYAAALTNTIVDTVVQLDNADGLSENKADAAAWPGPGGPQPVSNYGGNADLWTVAYTRDNVNAGMLVYYRCSTITPDADLELFVSFGMLRVFYYVP